ncbi:hypothetical protein C7374_1301, partial [Falsochrobactrum ovis]
MILLNRVVHIFTATNGNRFSSLAEPALCIALHYSYSVGLAGVVTLSFSDRKGPWLVDIQAKQAAIFHASKAS